MPTDLDEIQDTLKQFIQQHSPPLRIQKDTKENFECSGNVECMQGRKKVDGMYFASIIPKPKDIRLYFFPIYTHPEAFLLSDDLKKCLKGKSCFHIKKMDEQLAQKIKEMIDQGVSVYRENQLLE
ncbi:MAG: DUF1801 domain-containing protein [Saprospiraceae bacterium]|nr:DUF1801 domain-containing protein [Saprospiraceae bacterium]